MHISSVVQSFRLQPNTFYISNMKLRLLLKLYLCSAIITVIIAQEIIGPSTQSLVLSSTTSTTRRSFWEWLKSFFHRKQNFKRQENENGEAKQKTLMKKWDLLIFSQIFPVPYCALKEDTWCKTYLNESQWIVRGIWPTLKNGERITDCTNTTFNSTALKDIMPRMKKHWISIVYPDEEFWSRQWTKHGSCSLDLFKNEIDYFHQGLRWNEQWPLSQILRKNGVLPSNEKVYKYKQLYEGIRSVVGHTPVVRCHSYKNMSFVKDVRLCISKKLKLIDCHKNYNYTTNCPQEGIMYPRTPDFYKKIFMFTAKTGQQPDYAANATISKRGLGD